jgi:hypothetical protein
VGIFCVEEEDRLVDKFKGCESLPVDVEELPSSAPLVLTALKDAAASAKTSGADDGNSSTSTGSDSQPLNLSTSRSSSSTQNIPTEA